MMRTLAGLALAPLLVMVVACSDEDQLLDTAEAPGVTPTVVPADLRAALLSLEDMPAEWTQWAAQDQGSTQNRGSPYPYQVCGRMVRPLNEGAIEERGVAFERSHTHGPRVLQQLIRYPAGEAERVLTEERQFYEACTEWRVESVRITVTPRALPHVGDDQMAYRITLDLNPGPNDWVSPRSRWTVSDYVVIRYGDVLLTIVHSDSDDTNVELDEALTEHVVRRADEKLRQAR